MRTGGDIRCNGPTAGIEENYQSRARSHKPRIGPSQLVVREKRICHQSGNGYGRNKQGVEGPLCYAPASLIRTPLQLSENTAQTPENTALASEDITRKVLALRHRSPLRP